MSQWLHNVSELLDALEQGAGKPGDLTSTLQHIAQTAQTFFAADACVIFVMNPVTGRFTRSLTAPGRLLTSDWEPHEHPQLDGIAPQVLRLGVLLVEDLDATPEYHSTFTRTEGIRSFAALALGRHRQKALGVLYLNFKQPQEFSADDYELFLLFADQISFILQETWLLRRQQEVTRIGQEINQELDTVDLLFKKLQTHAASILDISHALLLHVYQRQTSTSDLYMQEEGHFIRRDQRPTGGASQYAIEQQQTVFIEHLSKQARHLPFQIVHIEGTEPKESFIFVPLMLREEPLGVLAIEHPEPYAYTQEDRFILELLANHIALALHNIRLYGSLSQLSKTGEIITRQLVSEETLQIIVDQIQEVTKADIAILYAYEATHQQFVFPPCIAGSLLDSTIQSMYPSRPDDITALVLHHKLPIFAKESATLYSRLGGNAHSRRGNFEQRERVNSTAAMPLLVGEEPVGVLFVNFRQPQRFDAPQKQLIEGLAHYAAIAIKNAQEFGTLSKRRIHELEILQYIDRKISSTLDLRSVLNTLLKLANEQVHADEASILLHNTRTKVLEIPAAIGPNAEDRLKTIVSLQETKGITRWTLEHKKPARVGNVLRDPQWRGLYIQLVADTISELDIPLLDGEQVVGVLNFESIREDAFHQEDEHFLLTLAGQAVLAIKNAQAYEREKRLAEEGQVLNQISKEITSQLDPGHVFNLILAKALDLTRSTLGSLHLYDPYLNELRMVADRGVAEEKKGRRQKLGEGIVGYVAKRRQLQNVKDVTQPPWNEIYMEFFPGARSELAVPMLAGGELRGVLNVESPFPNNFSESDERLLQGLADLAVVALQNAQAYEREKRLLAEARVLNEISKEITSQLDPTHVFDLILEKALELTHSHMGNLNLYDPKRNDLWMAAERGVAEEKKGLRQKLGQGVVGYAAAKKQLLNVADVTQPPWKESFLEYFPGTRSELAAPMLAGDELRGVLNVESSSPNNFNESDERLLQGLAGLAVVALQNAERYEKAEREAQRFKLLYQAGQELSKIADLVQLEQAYDVVVRIADRQSQSQAVIYRYNETNAELVLKCASPGRHAPLFDRIKLGEGLSGQVARERRTIVVHDADNPPPGVGPVKKSDPRMLSLIVTPILFKDRYYGNLGLRHEVVGHFRDTDTDFYVGLAQQLASTIYRLETLQARQESEQRAKAAETMSWIGHMAFELTHRWDNDLGLVRSYVNDIQSELQELGVTNTLITKKLGNIVETTRTVLDLSKNLKQEFVRSGEAAPGEPVLLVTRSSTNEPVNIHPRVLLEEVQNSALLPPTLEMHLVVDEDVTLVRVIHSLVADILRNLVSNAIDAMPEGGKITLSARNDGRFVALEVSDTGIGIPRQSLSKIFDLFYSSKGSSGFGLWSARRMALRNHGELMVKSEVGRGTTFTLLLPRVEGVQLEALL